MAISMNMIVSAIQFYPQLGEIDKNLEKISKLISEAAENNAELVVLPELANTGYNLSPKEAEKFSEIIPEGVYSQLLMKLAEEYGLYIASGIAERDDENIYNSAILVGPKGYIGTYRKIHLFDNEKLIFERGMNPPQVFDIGSYKAGMMICFDWAFPEVARILALEGADIIIHPANLVLPYGQLAMRVRSLENHVFSITANRIGEERGLVFTGKSQIIDIKGNIVSAASEDRECIIYADLGLHLARNKKITKNNDLFQDRIPSLYSKLIE